MDDIRQVTERLSALVGAADVIPQNFDQSFELRCFEDHLLDYCLSIEDNLVVLD